MQEAADGNRTTARVKEGLAAYGERGPSQGGEVVRKRQRDTHIETDRPRDRQTDIERQRETKATQTERGRQRGRWTQTEEKSCLNKANQSGLMG